MLITDQSVLAAKQASFSAPEACIAVIADFDHTLTPLRDAEGNRSVTSVASLRYGPGMGDAYAKAAHGLFETYHTHDINPLLSLEEKTTLMVEWYTRHFDLMFREGLTRDVVRGTGDLFSLREGVSDLIAYCGYASIPFIVMSAGLGDVILEGFRSRGLDKAVSVVSNFFRFDEEGRATGLLGDMIHPYNKFVVPLDVHVPAIARKRPTHIIVIGDHIGDSRMADSFVDAEILKIGLLDEQQMERLPEYQAHFDILLFGNDSLEPVQAFLERARCTTAV